MILSADRLRSADSQHSPAEMQTAEQTTLVSTQSGKIIAHHHSFCPSLQRIYFLRAFFTDHLLLIRTPRKGLVRWSHGDHSVMARLGQSRKWRKLPGKRERKGSGKTETEKETGKG